MINKINNLAIILTVLALWGWVSETEFRESTTKTGDVNPSLSAGLAPASGRNWGTLITGEDYD
tara:strand:- start:628 stop:816 length:189 start_codon:yes stop_codon:yes gene_type:complete